MTSTVLALAMMLASPATPTMTTTTTEMTAAGAKAPLLEISKKCPGLRFVGRDATFEITVTNKGEGAASNVVVTDPISPIVQFVSADNGGTRDGNNVVWRFPSMPAGDSKTLKVNVKCNQIGTVKNSAMVQYCVELADACEFEVKGIPAILLECVDDPDPIEVGGNVTYTIIVTNQGSAVGTNIVVTCNLPESEEFVSAGGATAGKGEGKKVTFAPLATLAPKARAEYKVVVKGTKEADARFAVELKSDQIETPVNETESTHIY